MAEVRTGQDEAQAPLSRVPGLVRPGVTQSPSVPRRRPAARRAGSVAGYRRRRHPVRLGEAGADPVATVGACTCVAAGAPALAVAASSAAARF
ncbi:MAG: hypothetical protein ACLQVI_21015 [Polyangiaceae bacterium]